MLFKSRILFVVQSLGKGGAERLVLDICQKLKKIAGVEYLIVSLTDINQYPKLSSDLEVKFIHSNISLSITTKSLINISEYEKIVDEFQPDIIHSHTYKSELVSRENPRKGIKYFTHVHSDFQELDPFSIQTIFNKKKLTNWYERQRILKRYKKVNNQFITISLPIHLNLQRQLGSSWFNNIHLLHNAIDYKKFSQFPLPILNSSKPNLVSVGRLDKFKNQIFLIEVLSFLKKSGIQSRLKIVGEGPEKNNIKEKAKMLGVEDDVSFIGLVDNVEEALSQGHIFVHSSISEAFGLVLIEAMAAGLPVVALDGGGNRELIQDGKNGFILSKDATPSQFASKILAIIKNKNLYEEMSRFSRQYAARFDINEYVDKLLEIYKR